MQEQLREKLHKGSCKRKRETTSPLAKTPETEPDSYGSLQHKIECVLKYLFSKREVTSTLQLFYSILCLALSLTEGKQHPASMVASYRAAYSGPANCSWPYVRQLEDFLRKKIELAIVDAHTPLKRFNHGDTTCHIHRSHMADWQEQDVWNLFSVLIMHVPTSGCSAKNKLEQMDWNNYQKRW